MRRFGKWILYGILSVFACGIIATFLPESSTEDNSDSNSNVQLSNNTSDTGSEEVATAPESSAEVMISDQDDDSEDKLQPTTTPEPTNAPPPTNTPSPTDTPTPTETPNPNLLTVGTYLVGDDIQPGIYLGHTGTGLFSSCYWERLKDLSGDFDALITNDNSEGQYYIEILESDFAFKTDCDLTYLESLPEAPAEFPAQFSIGTYLVGIDIRAGTYRGQGGSDTLNSCYWERTTDVTGGFDSLITNNNSVGQFYVEIVESDFAFKTGCDVALLDPFPEPVAEFPTTINTGMYLVGIDIQPGIYKGVAGTDILDSCYWERLRDVSGSFNSLIANDNASGEYFVQVSETDFALNTGCPLEFTGN